MSIAQIKINGNNENSTLHNGASMEHGMYTMHANKNLYEPARQNNFEFVIAADALEDLTSLSTGGSLAQPAGTSASSTVQELLRLSVQSSSVPHYSVEPITQRRGNSVQKFAGQVSFSDGQLTIYDWIGVNAKEIILSWMNQVYDVTTDKIGLLGDYKKDAELIEYTPDWQEIRKWKLIGCWPSSISEDTFDHTSSAERKMTVTIQYDLAKLQKAESYSG